MILGPRGPPTPSSSLEGARQTLRLLFPTASLALQTRPPSWRASRMSRRGATHTLGGNGLSWAHRPPLDAIMRVPTRRQGRCRATYQFRISGMRLLPRRERSLVYLKGRSHLVSTTTAQPEDIKLALSRAEPPPSQVEGAWEERGGGSVYDSTAAAAAAMTGAGSAESGRVRNVWVSCFRRLRNQGGEE